MKPLRTVLRVADGWMVRDDRDDLAVGDAWFDDELDARIYAHGPEMVEAITAAVDLIETNNYDAGRHGAAVCEQLRAILAKVKS